MDKIKIFGEYDENGVNISLSPDNMNPTIFYQYLEDDKISTNLMDDWAVWEGWIIEDGFTNEDHIFFYLDCTDVPEEFYIPCSRERHYHLGELVDYNIVVYKDRYGNDVLPCKNDFYAVREFIFKDGKLIDTNENICN